jgi:hypothetical protein
VLSSRSSWFVVVKYSKNGVLFAEPWCLVIEIANDKKFDFEIPLYYRNKPTGTLFDVYAAVYRSI